MWSFAKTVGEVYETPPSPSRIIPMEGVRGLAVGLVFFVHFNALFRAWATEGGLTARVWTFLGNIGHSGVDLFFVLSGFLIYGAVVSKNTPYPKFMARRVQRIYPPFLAVFVIYLILSVLFPGENKIPSGAFSGGIYLLENLLLLPGIFDITPMITVAWSLSYEIFYYLLIPVIVLWLGMRQWKTRTRAGFFAALALAYTAYCTLDIYPRLQLIMFVSGILLFETLRASPKGPERGSTWKRDLLGLAALLICFPVATLPHGWFFKIVLQFHAFFFFLYACFRSNSFLCGIFSMRPLRYLGNMSYSYYLIHGLTLKFVAMVFTRVFPPARWGEIVVWASLPLAFAATWLVSTLLYMMIEKPFSLPAVLRSRASPAQA